MNRGLTTIFLLIWAFLTNPISAAESTDAPQAQVRAGLETTDTVWVGQQIGLTVDILSTGSTFNKQRVYLPDVAGALILEDAATTIYLSERIDGQTWQVLRYRYPMFVQRAGTIEVPSIDVAFEISTGYGSTGVAFDLDTNNLSLSVSRPGGVTDLQKLVTTTRFTLDVETTPATSEFMVGDALTRRITRSAVGVSGMAFAPLAVTDVPGVAVYAEAPLIDDSSNRGDLQGKRVDATTWVMQTPGEVTLPGIALQWWDPVAAELNVETVPAITLNVASHPALANTADQNNQTDTGPFPWLWLAIVALLGVLGWRLSRYLPTLKTQLQNRARTRALTEPARFKQLQNACRSNDAALAYNAYLHWAAAEQAPAATILDSAPLKTERENVQRALINADGNWQGAALASAARNARKRQQSGTKSSTAHSLAALNPTEAKGIAQQL